MFTDSSVSQAYECATRNFSHLEINKYNENILYGMTMELHQESCQINDIMTSFSS
jgi:hypothetical protein